MDKLKKVLLLLIALIPPLCLSYLVNQKYILLIVLSLCTSLFLIYKDGIIQLILSILLLSFFYISIIIIPFSFYNNWLLQLSVAIPKGRITNLILSIWIFSYIYNTLNVHRDRLSILKNIIISLTIFLILFNLYEYLIVIPILFIFFIIIINRKLGLKVMIQSAMIFTLLLIISANISDLFPTNGSSSVNNLSYSIRSFLISKFPDIDILTSIPGSEGISKSRGKAPLLTSNKLFKIWGNPGDTYYLRMNIEDSGETVKIIENEEVKKANINSVKLQVLSDYLPIIPTINGGLFNTTVKTNIPLNREDYIYLNKNSNIDIQVDSFYTDIGFVNNSIYELALSLKGNSDEETLLNIKKYLHQNYTYSTETKNKANYIDDFLFNSKKGFCVHFTRSFILLSRINKISSREISGYYIDIKRPENDVYKGFTFVTGKNSHMWPEVYINGKWTTYEVTPGYHEALDNKVKESVSIRKNESVIITSENEDKGINIIPYITSAVLLIFTILIILVFKADPIKRIIKKASKLGISHPSKIGWVEWNNLAFNSIEYKNIFLEYAYKKRTLSNSDKAKLKKLSKLVGNNL